jgi:hypothetical protein
MKKIGQYKTICLFILLWIGIFILTMNVFLPHSPLVRTLIFISAYDSPGHNHDMAVYTEITIVSIIISTIIIGIIIKMKERFFK